MNKQDFDSEINKRICFKCTKEFNLNEVEELVFVDYPIDEHENVADKEPQLDLTIPLCSDCFEELLIERGFKTCDCCGKYSKNLQTVCSDEGRYSGPPEDCYPADYQEVCPDCFNEGE